MKVQGGGRDAPNIKSALQLQDKAIEKINKEVKLGNCWAI